MLPITCLGCAFRILSRAVPIRLFVYGCWLSKGHCVGWCLWGITRWGGCFAMSQTGGFYVVMMVDRVAGGAGVCSPGLS